VTAPITSGHAGPPLDTHDMVVIHRAFPRESLLLASLIAGVEDGDRRRARALAAHLRWYRLGLIWQTYGQISCARHIKRVRGRAAGLDTSTTAGEPRLPAR
jgi:hypothetical protein